MGRLSPLAHLSFEELWGIIQAPEWTEEELDTPRHDRMFAHFTYKKLLSIAGRGYEQSKKAACKT
jgi:hypothetical protein